MLDVGCLEFRNHYLGRRVQSSLEPSAGIYDSGRRFRFGFGINLLLRN